jgi:hypothetical protein
MIRLFLFFMPASLVFMAVVICAFNRYIRGILISGIGGKRKHGRCMGFVISYEF